MKHLLILISFLLSGQLYGQITSAWTGYFEGTLLGLIAPLEGKAQGNAWKGVINVNGYVINLDGSIVGDNCEGTMSDPQAQTAIPFRSSMSGDLLTIRIHDVNPLTGVKEDMELVFEKKSDSTRDQATYQEEPSSFQVIKGKLDPNLVGRWRYTNAYVSGDFSFATDYFMKINADGSLLYTDGRTAGGGPNSSIDSGDGDVYTVSWKAENKIIYLNDGNGWQEYARYYQEGDNLMLTYGNGNKQVWERL